MQAPSSIHSQDFPQQTGPSRSAVSLVKEKAKMELLETIKEQNVKYG